MAGYTLLAATDKLSDSRSVLNGISTRRVSIPFANQPGGTATTSVVNGQFYGEDFTISDQCHAAWIVCDRVANDTDITIRLHVFLTVTVPGGSDVLSFDVDVTYVDITSDTELSTTVDATLDTGDVAVGAGASSYVPAITVTIPNASVGNDIHVIGLEIKRKAAIGTDYAADVTLVGVEAQYTIQR